MERMSGEMRWVGAAFPYGDEVGKEHALEQWELPRAEYFDKVDEDLFCAYQSGKIQTRRSKPWRLSAYSTGLVRTAHAEWIEAELEE